MLGNFTEILQSMEWGRKKDKKTNGEVGAPRRWFCSYLGPAGLAAQVGVVDVALGVGRAGAALAAGLVLLALGAGLVGLIFLLLTLIHVLTLILIHNHISFFIVGDQKGQC